MLSKRFMLSATGKSSGIVPPSSSMVFHLFLSRSYRAYPRNGPHLVLTINTGFFRFFNYFLLPTPPFSSIRQQNGTESYLSAVDDGCTPFFQCSVQCIIAHHPTAVCATFKESSGAFSCLLCSVQLVVDTKKEDERIDNAEQIDHCEANEAAQQHPAVV